MNLHGSSALIICGVHKAGTTSLFSYLSRHPAICPSIKKETHFFSRRGDDDDISLEKYAREFACTNGVLCEADPEYIYGGKSLADAIFNLLPDAKIIFLLREQIDKLNSNYRHQIKTMKIPDTTSFAEFLRANANKKTHFGATLISEGYYYSFLMPWFDVFPSNQIKVCFFDDLCANPGEVVGDIVEWVGLKRADLPQQQYEVENKSLRPKNKFLHAVAYSIYRANERFFRESPLFRKIKKIYFSLNTSEFSLRNEFENSMELDCSHSFIKTYANENRKLREYMSGLGYSAFPEWMK